MEQDRYDIVFSGELMDGFAHEQVSANLEKLFKSPAATIAKLMSGATVVVKRGTDLDTARKYLMAMQKAGAVASMRPAESAPPVALQPDNQASQVAGAPAAATTSAPAPATTGDLSLAPPGSDVLREEERTVVTATEVSTDHIKLASTFAAPEESAPPPPAPDTSHISVAEVGADVLPERDNTPPPPPPDTSALDIAEPGAMLGSEEVSIPLPEPDLSHISLSPPGAALDEIKSDKPPVNPDISHLSLADPQS